MIKSIIIAILATLLFLCLIVFLVDRVFYLKNEVLSKFHIGRWTTDEQWHEAIKKTSKKWSLKTPTVRITDNSRYIILDMINGKYRSQSIQSWQTAALILALLQSDEKSLANDVVSKYIDKDGSWIKKPVAVDAGLLSYSFMKTVDDVDRIKPAMDYMLDIIIKFKDENDIICYSGNNKNPEKYVDTLGLVCPFLTCYANVYNKPEYEKLAFKQLEFYHSYGLYADTCLPNHALNSETHLPLGVFGWGRGVAWYSLGILGTYQEATNNAVKDILKDWIKQSAEQYHIYQRDDGGFGAILQRTQTYDSSATAFLSYFYFECFRIFREERYYEVAKECLTKLKKCTRISGALDICQGDTKGIGIFAQYYDIMPFAQGFALNAIELSKKVKD